MFDRRIHRSTHECAARATHSGKELNICFSIVFIHLFKLQGMEPEAQLARTHAAVGSNIRNTETCKEMRTRKLRQAIHLRSSVHLFILYLLRREKYHRKWKISSKKNKTFLYSHCRWNALQMQMHARSLLDCMRACACVYRPCAPAESSI